MVATGMTSQFGRARRGELTRFHRETATCGAGFKIISYPLNIFTCGAKGQARLREQILGLGLLLPETIAQFVDMITSSDKM